MIGPWISWSLRRWCCSPCSPCPLRLWFGAAMASKHLPDGWIVTGWLSRCKYNRLISPWTCCQYSTAIDHSRHTVWLYLLDILICLNNPEYIATANCMQHVLQNACWCALHPCEIRPSATWRLMWRRRRDFDPPYTNGRSIRLFQMGHRHFFLSSTSVKRRNPLAAGCKRWIAWGLPEIKGWLPTWCGIVDDQTGDCVEDWKHNSWRYWHALFMSNPEHRFLLI